LLSLLRSEGHREKLLKLLAICPASNVSPALLQWLVVEGSGEWENFALVRMAGSKGGAAAIIGNPEAWIGAEGASPALKLQVLLAVLANPDGRAAVLGIASLPQLFLALISARHLEFLGLIGGLLKKCPIDEAFVERVLESGCVRALAEAVAEVRNEGIYRSAFEFAEVLGKVKWADEFGAWIRVAVECLSVPESRDAAAEYLLAVSRRPEGVALLRQAGVHTTLSQNGASFPATVRQVITNLDIC
jgi:hypothetical protein